MKKILIYCLSLVVLLTGIFSFTACGGAEDLAEDFYNAENWTYMTNNNGATNDGGGVPYSLDDGSIKFHNANQAYLLDKDLSNDKISFMIKTSKDWQMWFRASTKDNAENDCYKLFFKDEIMQLQSSESTASLAQATAEACGYETNEWNKLELSFNTDESGNCTVQLTVNGETAPLVATEGVATAAEGKVTYAEPEDFTPGNYVIVKVWYGDCYLQLKPLAKEKEEDVLKIACIGDSITYGSNADNVYTDSYPAQLQKLYGGSANVMNFGKSGATIRDSADDPYRKTQEYNGAMLFEADVAIIMLGTNDSKTYQAPTYQAMMEAYAVLLEDLWEINPSMEIYIATSPYAYSSAYQISNSNIENAVVPAQKAFARENSLELIDMHEFTANLSGCYADGIHPTTRGYTYLAYMMHCSLNDVEPDEAYVNSFKD